MIKMIKRLFSGKQIEVEQKIEAKYRRGDYICLTLDPVNTVNKLDRENPNWNMDKVQQGLFSGMLRYATDAEIETAINDGKLKS